MIQEKRCNCCGETKPRVEYHRSSTRKDGMHAYCKACTKTKNAAWVTSNRDRQRAASIDWYRRNKARATLNGTRWHYKKHYGITHDQFLALVPADRQCPICRKEMIVGGKKTKRSAVLDHCHASGAIRGVICSACNLGLGYFDDSRASMSAAISYLARAVQRAA